MLKREETNKTIWIVDPKEIEQEYFCIWSDKGPKFAYSNISKKQEPALVNSYTDETGILEVYTTRKRCLFCEVKKWTNQ
jgi:hypothetical protein